MARVSDRKFSSFGSKIVPGLALAAGLLSACAAATLPEVSPTAPPPAREGVLVGRFGVVATRSPGAEPPLLKLERVADGRTFQVTRASTRSDDGGHSVAFAVRVPPGQYRLTAWQVSYDGRNQELGDDLGVQVTASAGQITCVGDVRLHPDHAEKDQAQFWLQPRCPELAGSAAVAKADAGGTLKFLVPRREKRQEKQMENGQVASSGP